MSNKRMTLLQLSKIVFDTLSKYGDMPVTIDDWMSEGRQLDRVTDAGVVDVDKHPMKAYQQRSYIVGGSDIKVFNIQSDS